MLCSAATPSGTPPVVLRAAGGLVAFLLVATERLPPGTERNAPLRSAEEAISFRSDPIALVDSVCALWGAAELDAHVLYLAESVRFDINFVADRHPGSLDELYARVRAALAAADPYWEAGQMATLSIGLCVSRAPAAVPPPPPQLVSPVAPAAPASAPPFPPALFHTALSSDDWIFFACYLARAIDATTGGLRDPRVGGPRDRYAFGQVHTGFTRDEFYKYVVQAGIVNQLPSLEPLKSMAGATFVKGTQRAKYVAHIRGAFHQRAEMLAHEALASVAGDPAQTQCLNDLLSDAIREYRNT